MCQNATIFRAICTLSALNLAQDRYPAASESAPAGTTHLAGRRVNTR